MSKEQVGEISIKDIKKILETPFWPQQLTIDTQYSRLHDDHDGTGVGSVSVSFDFNGDGYICTHTEIPGSSLRFRTELGGGMSLRVRNALLVLALAIQLDTEQ